MCLYFFSCCITCEMCSNVNIYASNQTVIPFKTNYLQVVFICSFKLRGFVQKRIYRKKHLFLCKLSQRNMLFKIVICFNERHSSSHNFKTTIKNFFSQFSFTTHFYTPLHSSKSHNLSQSIYKETDILIEFIFDVVYIGIFDSTDEYLMATTTFNDGVSYHYHH